jgi:hypothetical protein
MPASTRRRTLRMLTVLMNVDRAPDAPKLTPPDKVVDSTTEYIKWMITNGCSEDEIFASLLVDTTFDEWQSHSRYTQGHAVAEDTIAEDTVAENTVAGHSKSKVTTQGGKQNAVSQLARPISAAEFWQYCQRRQSKAGKDTQNGVAPRSSKARAFHQQRKQQKARNDTRKVVALGPVTEAEMRQAVKQATQMLTAAQDANPRDVAGAAKSLGLGESETKHAFRIFTALSHTSYKQIRLEDVALDMDNLITALTHKILWGNEEDTAGQASQDGTDAAEISNDKPCRQEDTGRDTQDVPTAVSLKAEERAQQAAGQDTQDVSTLFSMNVPEPLLNPYPYRVVLNGLEAFGDDFR